MHYTIGVVLSHGEILYIMYVCRDSICSFFITGDVPRVDGQLAVARAFGDKNLKCHLSSEPDIVDISLEQSDEFLILASDGLWKVSDPCVYMYFKIRYAQQINTQTCTYLCCR